MTLPRAVVFDFDGVIVDSESLHLKAFRDVFAERGWHLRADAYFERYLGLSDRGLVEAFSRDNAIPTAPDEVARVLNDKQERYAALANSSALLYAGAEACVRRLAASWPLAIASGSLRGEILDVLDATGLRDAFAHVVGADDVMESKPSPMPYLEAARRLQVPPSACIAIEDSPWGLDSALAAGMRTIGITHTYPAARLIAAAATVESLDLITEPFVRALFNRS